MKVDLATTILGWDKKLGTLDHLLTVVADHASARRVREEDMLEWRLAPDMFDLRQQAQAVCNLVRQWSSRAAGLDLPRDFSGPTSVAELKAIIAECRSALGTIQRSRFENRDNVQLTVDLKIIEPVLPIGEWVVGFATTNIVFHLTIAYAILRANGIPLGKQDLFAGGL